MATRPLDRTWQVAIVIDTTRSYARGALQGVNSYLLEHGPWSLYFHEYGMERPPGQLLKKWADGAITRFETAKAARGMARLGVPFINLGKDAFAPGVMCIGTDDRAIGVLAADHLLERNFHHFAACGLIGKHWSDARCRHFCETVEAAGGSHNSYKLDMPHDARDFEQQQQKLTQWLSSLPRPLGVFASLDAIGRRVLDACNRAGLLVPEEVAVLGVDNDELLCHLASPPLSSVAPDAQRTGYLAAEMLDRMMGGESLPSETHFITPLGVVTRRSTDIVAIDDQDILEAVRFMRAHACDGITISDVTAKVRLSRRAFEHRFTKLLGRTPHAEISRIQLNRAIELLTNTKLSVATIAVKAGFNHVEYMSAVFKKKLGKTPSQIRAEFHRVDHT